MRFTIFQDSLIGGRKYNQDRLAYSYSRDVLLMVVADGMGGHANGEVAADIAVTSIIKRFQQEAIRDNLRRPADFLEIAVNAAHRAIIAFADQQNMLECPRTTVVACLIQNGRAWWAHVGDSRLYVFRRGQLAAATSDHSRVQQLLDAGVITPAQAAVHPDRNKIYNCLGGVQPPMVTTSTAWPLLEGDNIVISSDGFWGQIDAGYIATTLQQQGLMECMPRLMQEAQRLGGAQADNLSVMGVTWEKQDEEDEPVSTTTQPLPGFTTSSLNTLSPDLALSPDEVTDDDIERAILEIQSAIRRVSKNEV